MGWFGARRPLRVAGVVLGAAVLLGAAGAGGYGLTAAVRDRPAPTPTRSAATPAALASLQATPAAPAGSAGSTSAAPSAATEAGALAGGLAAPALGDRLTGEVVDVATGAVLWSRQPTVPVAPASTAKVLTAAAILTVHAPTDRFTTRVLAGPGTAVTLVGGGDPTLTAATAGAAGAYPGAARITDLATQLRAAGLRPSAVVVDDSLFTGPAVSPAWAAEDVPSSYGAPITAAMVDGGRDAPEDPVRSAHPDLAAGHALAAALGSAGLPVRTGSAAAGARQVAAVRSADVATLVRQMLQSSDNVIADVLGRQVALARGRPASFTGGAQAIRQVLTGLGVDPGGGLVDASGLAASDRVGAAALTGVLRLACDAAQPALRDLVAGLPVADWSGTLAGRYAAGSAHAAAGLVRAKTGTLTGVSTLAGVVPAAGGRQLTFAFMAVDVPSTADADAALDELAAALVRI